MIYLHTKRSEANPLIYEYSKPAKFDLQLKDPTSWIQRLSRLVNGSTTKFYINSTGETITIRNPNDDSVVGEMQISEEAEVNAAVTAARTAFETGDWSRYTGAQRAACMNKFADLLETEAAKIAKIESSCMGMPISVMQGALVPRAAKSFRFYAGFADKVQGETFPIEDNSYRIVQYEPLGVCAGICAWNFTLIFLGWKLAPALAAGNTYIFKSSEKAPFSLQAVAPLFKEAGFPPGVVNFITGDGKTGALLAHHMDIDKIAFTGSNNVGRKIQEASAKSNLKKVSLELGGKSPAIVFDDVDAATVIPLLVRGFLWNSGQICFCPSRLLLQKKIAAPFTAALKGAFTGALGMTGNQLEAQTVFGPLADKSQLESVLGYIESGRSEAELLVGGARHGDTGNFVQPTIFINPKDDAKIYREEIFGPVLVIKTFDTEEEAVRIANDTSFGLSACIYTANVSRALVLASKIKAGTVSINGPYMPDFNTPFGGWKESGSGRECGKQAMDAYLQTKTIKINLM
ncbi:hypothetical protein EG327_009076 [Venturia inaequalis]|uniref:aldehyde dehydrogenase (NAD(+)) n=1 Tax=Venturia inaequalis TaxID=5025 RepID=A0A8H3VT89_VENIN|nr:hypothetical protein EG327_009076 [Venturia inaequalis]